MSEMQALKIVEDLYRGPTTTDGWLNALNQVADLAGAELASLAIASPQEGLFTVLSPRTEQDLTREFAEAWLDKDITLPATMSAEVGKIVTLEDTGRDRLLSSEFYNDFWNRTGHGAERIRVNLLKNQKAQVNFGLSPYRHSDEISTQMHQTALVFIPHLVQAVSIQYRMRQLQLERTLSSSSVKSGIAVVNSDGRVLTADSRAERMLSGGGPLLTRKGQIQARSTADTATIQRMIASCAPRTRGIQLRGGVVSICYAAYPVFNVSILPVMEMIDGFSLDLDANSNPVAVVAFEDPDMERRCFADDLTQRFGLTPAETLVAIELMDGDGRKAVATCLGVSESTVRSHMSRIFEKTDVQRQAQLVRLLLKMSTTEQS